jgi:hypothetical protein
VLAELDGVHMSCPTARPAAPPPTMRAVASINGRARRRCLGVGDSGCGACGAWGGGGGIQAGPAGPPASADSRTLWGYHRPWPGMGPQPPLVLP